MNAKREYTAEDIFGPNPTLYGYPIVVEGPISSNQPQLDIKSEDIKIFNLEDITIDSNNRS